MLLLGCKPNRGPPFHSGGAINSSNISTRLHSRRSTIEWASLEAATTRGQLLARFDGKSMRSSWMAADHLAICKCAATCFSFRRELTVPSSALLAKTATSTAATCKGARRSLELSAWSQEVCSIHRLWASIYNQKINTQKWPFWWTSRRKLDFYCLWFCLNSLNPIATLDGGHWGD